MPKIGIVIPTSFARPEYLPLAYSSIISQIGDFELEVIVGVPKKWQTEAMVILPRDAVCIASEDGQGLASKLNQLIRQTSRDCDFLGWIGDDDILKPGSLAAASETLQRNPSASLVYGGCDYIDIFGNISFTNPSGSWASGLLTFGPQLIPQPGSLFRKSAFESAGGLDPAFDLAFDFDLLLKLRTLGPLIHINQTLAQFRWHPDSLSVKHRMTSALEASRVRRRHYRGIAKLIWPLWEPWVVLATWFAGKLVTFRIG